MRKRIFSLTFTLLICFSMLFAMASCSFTPTPPCTAHADADSNHLCDTCKKEMSTCADEDKNHLCDLCEKAVSLCADEDGDHLCDLCEEVCSTCADEDGDHLCDVCEETLSACADEDDDHLCDVCEETLSACADEDDDHLCDLCAEVLSACTDEGEDGLCDICEKPITVGPNGPNDTETPGSTPTDPGPAPEDPGIGGEEHVCADINKDHVCDNGCSTPFGVHADTIKDHFCDHCNAGGFGTHADLNGDHICDYGCTSLIGDCCDLPGDGDHLCDYGCGEILSECVDFPPEDGICNECLAQMKGDDGTEHICADTNKNHVCDNGCSNILGDHTDEDLDHACNYGCDAPIGDHLDTDFNHKCDYGCALWMGEHADPDFDHICNYGCAERIGECTDDPADGDHLCDHGCGEVLSECADVITLDGICDDCEKPLGSAHDCTDTENYDGYCDICYAPIAGIENLYNPYLIGYSSEPNGPFEESGGLLIFEYYKRNLVYLKFNCRVELLFLSIMETPIEELIFVSADESGCIYSFWTPDIDSIFAQRNAEIYFKTPYSSECFGSIQYSCIPAVMPEFLGTVENGTISENPLTLLKGDTYTLSFALNVRVDELNAISSYFAELEILDWDCTEGSGQDEFIYTVTVRDTYASITAGELELTLYYTYLGASNSGGDSAFPPAFFLHCNIVEPTPVTVSVNGLDLSSLPSIPYSDAYIFTVIFSAPPTDAFIEINGQQYYGLPDFADKNTYTFTVRASISGYHQIYIFCSNGTYDYAPTMLNAEFLENGQGGEGGEGVGGGNDPLPEETVEILSVYNAVFEMPVGEDGVIHAYADGKISIDITFSRELQESYMRVNGDDTAWGEYYNGAWSYSFKHPMSSGVQEGTVEICIFENGEETVVAIFTFRIAAAEFYGIYTQPDDLDTENKPSGVTVNANEVASVYIALTASVEPTSLYIASGSEDIHLTAHYDPWSKQVQTVMINDECIYIWFYQVDIPADLLVLGEEESSGVQKLAFLIEQENGVTIWKTYTVNFS